MRKLWALFRREFLEHRGAFFYAPIALLAIFGVGLGLAILTNRLKLSGEVNVVFVIKVYQTGSVALAEAWWVYLLAALFFYFADAFSSDRRNNAMLFWKSMPVTDFGMLMSKMLTGLLLFPAIVYVFALVSGMVLFGLAFAAKLTMLPGLMMPAPEWLLVTVQQIAWFELCQFVLGLLWYAPLFAWVGLLSTFFRRWSIPLSIAIPALVALLENAAFYGVGPIGGYVWTYFTRRLQFGPTPDAWWNTILSQVAANVPLLTSQLLAGIDWVQLWGGVVVAVVLIYIASLYRRRGIAA